MTDIPDIRELDPEKAYKALYKKYGFTKDFSCWELPVALYQNWQRGEENLAEDMLDEWVAEGLCSSASDTLPFQNKRRRRIYRLLSPVEIAQQRCRND